MQKQKLVIALVLVLLLSATAKTQFFNMEEAFANQTVTTLGVSNNSSSPASSNQMLNSLLKQFDSDKDDIRQEIEQHAATIANSLVTKAPMNDARAGLGAASVNGKIYAVGGSYSLGFSVINEEYDPATDNWTPKTLMPTPRDYFGLAVYQNKIYCIGGNLGYSASGYLALGANEVYNPANNSWTKMAPMPTPRGNLQANVVGDKIYLIGGIKADPEINKHWSMEISNAVEVYNPINDTWTTKTPMPTAVANYFSAVINNKIYIISSGLNQIYNPENNSWSFGAPSASFDYVFGGVTTGMFAPQLVHMFTATKVENVEQLNSGPGVPQIITTDTASAFKIQCYDPQTDNWTIINASMPIWRYDPAVASVDDKFYVIGGDTVKLPQPQLGKLSQAITYSVLNEQYTPPDYGTIPPTVSVVSPENTNYSDGNVSLDFTLNKPVSWIGYSLDGQNNLTITGNTTMMQLPSGLHNVTVYANDTFGNFGESETVNFNIAEQQRPFPTTIVAAVALTVAFALCVGLIVAFKKHLHNKSLINQ